MTNNKQVDNGSFNKLTKKPWQLFLASIGCFTLVILMEKAGFGSIFTIFPDVAGFIFLIASIVRKVQDSKSKAQKA